MSKHQKIRIRALFAVDDLIAELGGDPDAVLGLYDLTAQEIYASNGFMNLHDFVSLLQTCAEDFDCPSFGLQLGMKQDIRILGPMGNLIRTSSDQREAMEAMRRFMFFHNQSEFWDYEEFGKSVYLRRYELFHDITDSRQYKELAFAACYRIISLSIGEKFKDVTVEFAHDAMSPERIYRDMFNGVTVRFNCEQDQWIIPVSYMDKPICVKDENVYTHLGDVYGDLDESGIDLEYQVMSLIQKSMITQDSKLDAVAVMLGMNKRTLQRHLKKRNIVFRQLLTDLRVKTACWYLTSTSLDVTDISEMLGYTDISNFSRAFKKNSGLSPLQWRKNRSISS